MNASGSTCLAERDGFESINCFGMHDAIVSFGMSIRGKLIFIRRSAGRWKKLEKKNKYAEEGRNGSRDIILGSRSGIRPVGISFTRSVGACQANEQP